MKFGQSYKRRQAQLLSPGAVLYNWVPYRELKKQIKCLDKGQCSRRKTEQDGDECPVCLVGFGSASNAVVTNCGHKVHAFCLVDSVTAVNQACPLCRTPLQDLIPSGFDGHALRFAAQLRISLDAVQGCHNELFQDLERRRDELCAGRGSLLRVVAMPVCAMRPRQARRSEMAREAEHLLGELCAALEYERLVYEAIRKIAKKFDKIAGSCMSKEVLKRMWKQGFFLDSSEGGNGRARRLYESLTDVLRDCGEAKSEGLFRRVLGFSAFKLLKRKGGVQGAATGGGESVAAAAADERGDEEMMEGEGCEGDEGGGGAEKVSGVLRLLTHEPREIYHQVLSEQGL